MCRGNDATSDIAINGCNGTLVFQSIFGQIIHSNRLTTFLLKIITKKLIWRQTCYLLAFCPSMRRILGMKKARTAHMIIITADTAKVGVQYWSNVWPTTFVPNTEPIRPNIIVRLMAIPLKGNVEKVWKVRAKSVTVWTVLTVNSSEKGRQWLH